LFRTVAVNSTEPLGKVTVADNGHDTIGKVFPVSAAYGLSRYPWTEQLGDSFYPLPGLGAGVYTLCK
jgi:hypothetical protein